MTDIINFVTTKVLRLNGDTSKRNEESDNTEDIELVGESANTDIEIIKLVSSIKTNIVKNTISSNFNDGIYKDIFGITKNPDNYNEFGEIEKDISFVRWFHSTDNKLANRIMRETMKTIPPTSQPPVVEPPSVETIQNTPPTSPPSRGEGIYDLNRLVWKTNSTTYHKDLNKRNIEGKLKPMYGYITTKSLHWCASYVRLSLTYAGLNPYKVIGKDGESEGDAKHYITHLPALGFKNIKEITSYADADRWTESEGQIGDVCVTPGNSYSSAGHICVLTIHNGKKIWSSDFWQDHMTVYRGFPKGIVFRFTGEIIEYEG